MSILRKPCRSCRHQAAPSVTCPVCGGTGKERRTFPSVVEIVMGTLLAIAVGGLTLLFVIGELAAALG